MRRRLPFLRRRPAAIRSPLELRDLQAWYDISDLSSLIVDGSNRVSLIGDKSGNSGVNCLVLNGAAGNYASAPDSAALSITGDIDIRVRVALNDWTPGAINQVIAKWTTTGNQRSYALGVNTAGTLLLDLSADGTVITSASSSVAVSATDLSETWVRATWRASDGRVQFFTSSNGTTWSQLGTDQTIAIASLFDSTAVLEMGTNATGTGRAMAGRIYRAQIYNGIGGTLAFDANFALPAKLATSFTESSSNAATVTINTSGALGARICGERDLVQLTVANQPVLSVSAGLRLITFDGSDDYMKAAPFSLSQPETVYFVGSQVTWTDNEKFYDGNTPGTQRMALVQTLGGASPNLTIFAGTTGVGSVNTLALEARGVISAVFNGASSLVRVNRGTAATGDSGSLPGGGFTLGAGQGGSLGQYGNITANEIAIYSRALNLTAQDRFALYAARKWRLSL